MKGVIIPCCHTENTTNVSDTKHAREFTIEREKSGCEDMVNLGKLSHTPMKQEDASY